jgi:hypothetical protein
MGLHLAHAVPRRRFADRLSRLDPRTVPGVILSLASLLRGGAECRHKSVCSRRGGQPHLKTDLMIDRINNCYRHGAVGASASSWSVVLLSKVERRPRLG